MQKHKNIPKKKYIHQPSHCHFPQTRSRWWITHWIQFGSNRRTYLSHTKYDTTADINTKKMLSTPVQSAKVNGVSLAVDPRTHSSRTLEPASIVLFYIIRAHFIPFCFFGRVVTKPWDNSAIANAQLSQQIRPGQQWTSWPVTGRASGHSEGRFVCVSTLKWNFFLIGLGGRTSGYFLS